MKEGKYYKIINTQKEVVIFKVSFVKNDVAFIDYYFYNNEFQNIKYSYLFKNKDYVEIEFFMIRDSLPDWHPDKKVYIRQQKIQSLLNYGTR